MTLHIFQSSKMPELYAFTIDPSGANLPLEDAPWVRTGNAIPLGTTMASTSPQIAQQVERDGYALVEGSTVSEPRLRKGDSQP